MGPEEIHIYFWEGAPRHPKRKYDQPKNFEVFLVNFQMENISNSVQLSWSWDWAWQKWWLDYVNNFCQDS